MKRFSPNPTLIASTSQQRMVLAVDGDYTEVEVTLALKKALEDIKAHIEFISPDDYKRLASWHIAAKALRDLGGEL